MSEWARLLRKGEKPQRLAVGLMSGMSRDGLDLALVRIRGRGDEPRDVDLVDAHTASYGDGVRERLAAALEAGVGTLATLDRDLAILWAGEVLAWLTRLGIAPAEVDFLGSHGQTVYHQPRSGGGPAATFQIGRGGILAVRTGIPVVSDFRAADVAAGGEGAPLVPLADALLYRREGAFVATLNLGSIANVSLLPPRGQAQEILAFDCGPANALLDALASHARPGVRMDTGGRLAGEGLVDDEILCFFYVERAAWLARPPPRSAGFETFGPSLARRAVETFAGRRPVDLLRTALEFAARTTLESFDRFVLPRAPGLKDVVASGGGCRNPGLIERLRDGFESRGLNLNLLPPPWLDGKEAVAFALLADETLQGRSGNVPSATGAAAAKVLGCLSLP